MNRRPEMIPPLFHTVSPIQPPPLRGTSFHRKEGVSTRAPSLGRGKGRSEAGLASFFGGARVLSYNRALETISLLFFIPLEPYPARSARHLPPAGKALSVVILFLHVSYIRFDDARKAASSYRSLPHWGRGTASAVDRVLSLIVDLRCISSLSFIPLSPIQPPPLRGTSFHRKEGASTRAPSIGRGCRAQRGGVGFLFRRRSRLLFAFPIGEGFAGGNGILVSSSIPRKNDRLLRAAVFMCITCLGKR